MVCHYHDMFNLIQSYVCQHGRSGTLFDVLVVPTCKTRSEGHKIIQNQVKGHAKFNKELIYSFCRFLVKQLLYLTMELEALQIAKTDCM